MEVSMSTIDLDAFPIIPRSKVGKILLTIILVAFISTGFSVFGVIFNEPQLIGPFPEAVFWHYLWYGIMHLVLVATYFLLFKPWAETVEDSAIRKEQTETKSGELEAIMNE